jgi:hypothetical protein
MQHQQVLKDTNKKDHPHSSHRFLAWLRFCEHYLQPSVLKVGEVEVAQDSGEASECTGSLNSVPANNEQGYEVEMLLSMLEVD